MEEANPINETELGRELYGTDFKRHDYKMGPGKRIVAGAIAALMTFGTPAVALADSPGSSPGSGETGTEQVENRPLRIAIASFQDSTGSTNGELSNLISDVLLEEFYEKGYDVIENDRLRAMLAGKGVSWSDFADNPYTVIGMLDGVDVLIFGDYNKISRDLRIMARYIDPETGDLLGKFTYIDDFYKLEREMLPNLAGYIQKGLDSLDLD